jgi:hypothetical protein
MREAIYEHPNLSRQMPTNRSYYVCTLHHLFLEYETMKTTLNKIRAHNPCRYGWEKLLHHLGKTNADDEPLSLIAILNSTGLDDAIWCLRAVDGHEQEKRLYAVLCARQVQHLMMDKRSLDALNVAERYANGQAIWDELAAAWAGVASASGGRPAAIAALAAWDMARAAQETKFREMFGDAK